MVTGRRWEEWRWYGVFALLAGAVAVFVPRLLLDGAVHPDFLDGYHPGAVGIQQGRGYVDGNGDLITHWPPGYSLIISPFVTPDAVASLKRLRYLSGFLAAGWVMLVSVIAGQVLRRSWRVVGVGLATLWPPLLALGDAGSSEMLFSVLLALSVVLAVKLCSDSWRSQQTTGRILLVAGLLGLSLGLASLTKTTGLSLALMILLALAIGLRNLPGTRRLQVAGITLVGIVLVVSPWIVAYRAETGAVGFTSAGASSISDGLRRFPGLELGEKLRADSEEWDSLDAIAVDVSNRVKQHPVEALILVSRKVISPWYRTNSGRFDRYMLLAQIPWLVGFLWSFGKLLGRRDRVRDKLLLLHLVVLSLWLPAVVALSIFRYLAPVFPIVVLLVLRRLEGAGLSSRIVSSRV